MEDTIFLIEPDERTFVLVEDEQTLLLIGEAEIKQGIQGIKGADAIAAAQFKSLTAPPGIPTDGYSYIVGVGATGAWAGQDNKIATYSASTTSYTFVSPVLGQHLPVVEDNARFYRWTGTAWILAEASAPSGSFLAYNAVSRQFDIPFLFQLISDLYAFAIADETNKVAFSVNNDGTAFATLFAATIATIQSLIVSGTITGNTLTLSGSLTTPDIKPSTDDVFRLIDGNNNIALELGLDAVLKLFAGLNVLNAQVSSFTSTTYETAIVDDLNQIALGLLKTGGLQFAGATFEPYPGPYALVVVDENNVIGFAISSDGSGASSGGSATVDEVAITSTSTGIVFTVKRVSSLWQLFVADPVQGETTGRQFTTLGNNTKPEVAGNSLSLLFVTDRNGSTEPFRSSLDGVVQVPFYINPASTYLTSGFAHVLGGGQSLSCGLFSTPPLTTTQPYNNKMLNTGVIAGGSGFTSLIPLIAQTQTDLANGQSDGETCLVGGTNRLSSIVPTKQTTGLTLDFIASNCARSGAIFTSINKTTTPYNDGLAQITAARSFAIAAGKSYFVPAIWFTHGEWDDGYFIAGYGAKLVQYQIDLDADIKAITGQSQNVLIFLSLHSSYTRFFDGSQTGTGFTAGYHTNPVPAPTVIPEIYTTVDANPTKFFIVCSKYHLVYVDGVHISNASQRWLGEKHAEVHEAVCYGGVAWKGLRPRTVTRSGTTITARFWVPKPPLQFLTSYLLGGTSVPITDPGTAKGFEVVDSGGTALTISSVTISSYDTVTIVVASGVPARLRYAWTGTYAADAGPTTGPRGLLADSDDYPSLYGNQLVNFCNHFDTPIT